MRNNDDYNTKEPKSHKKIEQKEKLWQLAPCCPKLLEDGLTQDGAENVCNVYLQHHPIRMGLQSSLNNMEHNLTTSFNHHPKLIWWQMKNKRIKKL
jgi:hypothetical protein